MNAELLSSISGVVFSLGFSYIPGLSGWYEGQSKDSKRLIMLGVLVLSALGIFGLACINRYNLVACSADGAWELAEYFVLAAIANQSAYLLTPRGE